MGNVGDACPVCGSPHLELIEMDDIPADSYYYWICEDCGAEFDEQGEVFGNWMQEEAYFSGDDNA